MRGTKVGYNVQGPLKVKHSQSFKQDTFIATRRFLNVRNLELKLFTTLTSLYGPLQLKYNLHSVLASYLLSLVSPHLQSNSKLQERPF